MRKILTLIGGLLAGIVVGLLLAGVGLRIFAGIPFSEFVNKMNSAAIVEMLYAILVSVASFAISLAVLVIAHEAGHLLLGLLTGYRFVSFRIFNLTFVKVDGRLRIKRFSIAGTGGQCLLTPPDLPLEKIPTGWYNAGGILMNLLLLLIAIPLLWLPLHPFVREGLVIFCLTDGALLLLNGLPMKVGGMPNDAYDILHLRHNMTAKKALVVQLRNNALIQDGLRPKELPEELMEWTTDIDFRNPMEVAIPLMYISRLMDEMQFEETYQKLEELHGHKAEILPLYMNEIACELAYCAMVTGRKERAQEIMDAKLMEYVQRYAKTMSSKQRLLFAKALYIDGDREEAVRLYDALRASEESYLMQGEVKSDLALMRHSLA